MRALLLSAGYGDRLKPYTLKSAKPTIPFYSVPMMGYSLYYLEKFGIDELTINLHYLPHTIKETIKKLGPQVKDINYSFEENILGSSGGIKQAFKKLNSDENFFVINADNVFLFPNEHNPLSYLYKKHLESRSIASLLVLKHPDAGIKFNALWSGSDFKYITRGLKSNLQSHDLNPYHFFGVAIYRSDFLNYIDQNTTSELFSDTFPKILKNNESVNLVPIEEGLWFETGSEEDYNKSLSEIKSLINSKSEYRETLCHILNRFSPHTNLNLAARPLSQLDL